MLALAVIGGLIVLFILLLCIPVDIMLRADLGEEKHFRVRLVWLLGLVRVNLTGRARQPRPVKEKVSKKTAPTFMEMLRQFQTFLEIIRVKGLMRQFLRLVVRLFKAFKFRKLAIDLRLGLGDPADTGMLFAFIGPVTPFINAYVPFPVSLQPLMADDPGVAGYLQGTVSLQPIRLVGAVLGFVFSRPVRKVMVIVVKRRWKNRH